VRLAFSKSAPVRSYQRLSAPIRAKTPFSAGVHYPNRFFNVTKIGFAGNKAVTIVCYCFSIIDEFCGHILWTWFSMRACVVFLGRDSGRQTALAFEPHEKNRLEL
jgi:hypothetical protein